MAIPKSKKIWFNGKFVNWDEAQIHVLSHVVHYGSSAFEGLRCYNSSKGPAVFRLKEHTKRLLDSCKIYNMVPKYSQNHINGAILKTVKVNKLSSCYIRPIVFRGYGEMGVNPQNCPLSLSIAAWKWGKYLGEDALQKGVDVKISSWTRLAQNTLPALAKVGANYMSSQLIKMEALADGYAEGIGLDSSGYISEGSGENIFVVRDGIIYTPPLSASALQGITRDSVMKIAHELNMEVKEMNIPREYLYIADEVFFTGTAAEITPRQFN